MTTSSKLETVLKKETISIIADVKENVYSKECYLNKCHGILIVKTYWDTHNGFNSQRSCLTLQMIDYSFEQLISVFSFEKIKTGLTNWICRVGFFFFFFCFCPCPISTHLPHTPSQGKYILPPSARSSVIWPIKL